MPWTVNDIVGFNKTLNASFQGIIHLRDWDIFPIRRNPALWPRLSMIISWALGAFSLT